MARPKHSFLGVLCLKKMHYKYTVLKIEKSIKLLKTTNFDRSPETFFIERRW